jgi:hypothetical protein
MTEKECELADGQYTLYHYREENAETGFVKEKTVSLEGNGESEYVFLRIEVVYPHRESTKGENKELYAIKVWDLINLIKENGMPDNERKSS